MTQYLFECYYTIYQDSHVKVTVSIVTFNYFKGKLSYQTWEIQHDIEPFL
jgi:hypothetical protein